MIRGGAGSIAYDATTNEAFAGSSDSIKRITPPGGSPGAGQTTNQIAQRKIERRVWCSRCSAGYLHSGNADCNARIPKTQVLLSWTFSIIAAHARL